MDSPESPTVPASPGVDTGGTVEEFDYLVQTHVEDKGQRNLSLQERESYLKLKHEIRNFIDQNPFEWRSRLVAGAPDGCRDLDDVVSEVYQRYSESELEDEIRSILSLASGIDNLVDDKYGPDVSHPDRQDDAYAGDPDAKELADLYASD